MIYLAHVSLVPNISDPHILHTEDRHPPSPRLVNSLNLLGQGAVCLRRLSGHWYCQATLLNCLSFLLTIAVSVSTIKKKTNLTLKKGRFSGVAQIGPFSALFLGGCQL